MNKNITVVVVTYNRVELLKRCIESLRNQSYRLTNIVVVNNASSDGTYDYLNSQSDITTVNMEYNSGGAGGFHFGMKKSLDLGADYIWIMDDDAIPDKDSLIYLVEAIDNLSINSKENWGFLCSKVIDEDGLPLNTPHVSKNKNKTGYPNWISKLELGLVEVEICTFVSVLFPRKIVESKGLPIKEMFIWGDDTEYTLRVSRENTSYAVGKSQVVHKRVLQNSLNIELETNENRVLMFKHKYKNSWYVMRKYYGVKGVLKQTLIVIRDLFRVLFSRNPYKFKKILSIVHGSILGVCFARKK